MTTWKNTYAKEYERIDNQLLDIMEIVIVSEIILNIDPYIKNMEFKLNTIGFSDRVNTVLALSPISNEYPECAIMFYGTESKLFKKVRCLIPKLVKRVNSLDSLPFTISHDGHSVVDITLKDDFWEE